MQSSGKRRSALTSAFEELALHTNERSPEVRDRPRAPPRAPPLPPDRFSRVSARDRAFPSLPVHRLDTRASRAPPRSPRSRLTPWHRPRSPLPSPTRLGRDFSAHVPWASRHQRQSLHGPSRPRVRRVSVQPRRRLRRERRATTREFQHDAVPRGSDDAGAVKTRVSFSGGRSDSAHELHVERVNALASAEATGLRREMGRAIEMGERWVAPSG